MSGSISRPNDSSNKMALNLCKAIELLKEKLSLLVIGRDKSDSVAQIV